MFAAFVMFRSRRETIQTGCGVIFLGDIVNNVMFVLIVLYITTVDRHSPKIIVYGVRPISVMF